MKDLPHADEANVDIEVLEREVKTCANILKILSQELYHVDRYVRMLSLCDRSSTGKAESYLYCLLVVAYLVVL